MIHTIRVEKFTVQNVLLKTKKHENYRMTFLSAGKKN